MNGTDLIAIGLFMLMMIGIVAVILMVYVFWRDSRITKLEHQFNGVLNIMEDYFVTWDRNLGEELQDTDRRFGQVWTYILSKR